MQLEQTAKGVASVITPQFQGFPYTNLTEMSNGLLPHAEATTVMRREKTHLKESCKEE
jgi:hypothetical protein